MGKKHAGCLPSAKMGTTQHRTLLSACLVGLLLCGGLFGATAAGARADMTMAVFGSMKMEQDPMGRCARTPANSAEGSLRWTMLGRK
jgi:hypothetical protein